MSLVNTSKPKSPSSSPQKKENFFGTQAKLNIGKSNDKYEQEADAVADRVVNQNDMFGNSPFIPAQPDAVQKSEGAPEEDTIQEKPIGDSITPLVQKQEEEEAVQSKEEDGEVQRSPEENSETALAPAPVQMKADEEIQEKEDEEIQEKEEESEVQKSSAADDGGDTSGLESSLASSKGGGSPMDSGTRSNMESGFGKDFGDVRVHTDDNAVQMNKDLGSQAFTNGNDIYFNEGKYNPSSKDGQHLLAHELTHTVQQGASTEPASVQKEEATEEPTTAPKPGTPIDISHRLELTDAWAKYLDAQYADGKRDFEVDVKIGERFSGKITLNKMKSTADGETAKYELKGKKSINYLKVNGWSFLNPLRDVGVEPVLVLEKFGEEQTTKGFLSAKVGEAVAPDVLGFIDALNKNLEAMSFLGIEPLKVGEGMENTFENGRLVFMVNSMSTVVDGFLEAGGGMGIMGDSFTFNLSTKVDVAGLASGEFTIARGEDGKLSGTGDIEADIANVNAKIHVEYIDGAVTIQGTGRIESEKFSGEITLLVTDAVKSKQMMNAALGVETMDAEAETSEAPPTPKTKGNQVLAGWGEVTASITPWLEGTAKVGIDSEGHVTIVGEITVPDEIELMEQRGKKVDIFKVEIRAGYGIPLVGQVFLFASIGMFMNAGFGPLVLKDVGFTGTYSTDPSVLQEFSVTGTLGINAFAILGLEAEAGVGLTLLGHDVKAGVNVTAAAGLRAYAEATPTLEYKEQASPEGGKTGETRLKGHFEAAAQLFMQLSGAFFVELDAPWWSPVSDGRDEYPMGEVQYPIGDSMGIGADMDWLVGSPEIPELKFSPVEFDADKFTADVMADPPPKKYGKSEEKPEGEWVDGNAPGDQKENPEMKDGEGLPENGKKKEDLKNLPDEEKYMRALDEMSKLEKAKPKPTLAVVNAKAKKIKSKYGLDKITVKGKGEEAEVFVKHKKQDNGKHLLMVPMMSEAERMKLLKTAMDDLTKRSDKAAGDEGTIEESAAKDMLSAWHKEHPVVESAKVVDGKETWDYFVDLGDKSETVKGKSKKTEATKDGVPEEGDGEVGKVVKFTDGEEKHTLWVEIVGGIGILKVASTPEAVEDKITRWENDLKGDEWKHKNKAAKKARIQSLLADVKTKLKAINDALRSDSDGVTAADDDAIESTEDTMAVSLKKLFQEFNEDFDFKILYAEELMKTHSSAKGVVDASVDVLSDAIENKKEIQSWNTLVEWLKATENTDKLFENPVKNGMDYGLYVVKQIEKVGESVLSDQPEDKRKEAISAKVDDIASDKNTHVFKALQNQILDKNQEKEADEKIKASYISGKTHGKYNPKKIIVKGKGNQLVVSYSFILEENGESREKEFTTTIEVTDISSNMIKHDTIGKNIALKDKGSRGNVDSVSNKDANKSLQDAGLATDTIEFNASHILADWFQGPGYLKTLNLITTSEEYNIGDMKAAETKIANRVRDLEKNKIKELRDANTFITFDLQVTAHYSILTDDKIVKSLNKTAMTDAEAQSAYDLLRRNTDPRLAEKVDYEVKGAYLNGDKSKPIPEALGIKANAGKDETLSDILS